jgi:hypothetical protein
MQQFVSCTPLPQGSTSCNVLSKGNGFPIPALVTDVTAGVDKMVVPFE